MIPLLWLSVAFGAGAAVPPDTVPAVIGLVSGSLLCAAAIAVGRAEARFALAVLAFVCLGIFARGMEAGSLRSDRLKLQIETGAIVSGDPVEIEGTISGAPEPAFDGSFLRLTAKSITHKQDERPASGVVRAFVLLASDEARDGFERLSIRHGSRLRVACGIEREERFVNPGVAPRPDMLDRAGVDATCTVKSPFLVSVEGRENENRVAAAVFEVRALAIERIRETFEPRTAGVLIASALGDKHFLDRETAEIFREGGTFHILVISGLHITFIGGLLLIAIGRITRHRIIQFVVTSVLLWAYALSVGGEAPVIRAAVMFTAVHFGRTLYRQMPMLNSVGAGAFVLLVIRPGDVLDPSFQLTFVSIAAITAMALPLIEKLRAIGEWMPDAGTPFPPNVPRPLRRFCETLYWNPEAWWLESKRQVWSAKIRKSPYWRALGGTVAGRAAGLLFEGTLLSAIVQIWMLPLMAFYFHRISYAAVVLNLWTGPIIAAETIIAALALVAGSVSSIAAAPFAASAEVLNWLLLFIPSLTIENGLAGYRVPAMRGHWAMVYLAHFAAPAAVAVAVFRWDPFALSRQTVKRAAAIVMPGAAVFLVTSVLLSAPWMVSTPVPDGRFTVRFLDVGQGDSAFITFPNGETMLIDGGGRIDLARRGEQPMFEPDLIRIGEAVVSETLWELGHSRVDHLVATHADADHIQGLVDVAGNFDIGRAYFPLARGPGRDAEELDAVLSRKGIETAYLSRGDLIEIGGVHIEVLHPGKAGGPSASENDNSLVLMMSFGETRFLFTGDIEAASEQELAEQIGAIRAQVLKVPHHGSRTSSTEVFARAVKPDFAVIPVGRRSMFGHPHPQVVEMWKTYGAEVTILGESGMAEFISDGKSLQMQHFRK